MLRTVFIVVMLVSMLMPKLMLTSVVWLCSGKSMDAIKLPVFATLNVSKLPGRFRTSQKDFFGGHPLLQTISTGLGGARKKC